MPGSDSLPPRSDLDVLAARAAASAYSEARGAGSGEDRAWQEAVDAFALHHPAWPRPLCEREAARTVGALGLMASDTPSPHGLHAPPLALVRALVNPALPARSEPRQRHPVAPWWAYGRAGHGPSPMPPSLPPGPAQPEAW